MTGPGGLHPEVETFRNEVDESFDRTGRRRLPGGFERMSAVGSQLLGRDIGPCLTALLGVLHGLGEQGGHVRAVSPVLVATVDQTMQVGRG